MDAPHFTALVTQDAPTGTPTEGQTTSPFDNMLVPILIVMVLFYVIMLGPERKQKKKREAVLGALKKGDKIMLNSGMYGSVAMVSDDLVTVQVADGVRIRFSRSAVQTVLDADGEAGTKEKAEKAKSEKAKA